MPDSTRSDTEACDCCDFTDAIREQESMRRDTRPTIENLAALPEGARRFRAVGRTPEEKLAYAEERWSTWYAIATSVEAESERLREAIASALTSLATGPAKDGYAYAVLNEALNGSEDTDG